MKLRLQEQPAEWRKFTLGVFGGLAALSLLLRWRRVLGPPGLTAWLAVLGLATLVCCLRPKWFRGFYRVGLTASFHVGQFFGQVVLTLFFWLLLTPLGLVLRLLGKDLLRLRRPRNAATYWQPARNRQNLEQMF